MGLRETLNQKPYAAAIAVTVMVVAAVWFMIGQLRASFSSGLPSGAYYTTDDGKTWFKDDYRKIPPFQVNGKEAVAAHVFKCNGKQIVGYLSRYSPQAKAAIDKFNAAKAANQPVDPQTARAMSFASMSGQEVKKPGDTKWTPISASRDATAIKCEDGSTAEEIRD